MGLRAATLIVHVAALIGQRYVEHYDGVDPHTEAVSERRFGRANDPRLVERVSVETH